MRHRFIPRFLLLSALTVSLHAAVSLPTDTSAAMPAEVEGPAKTAMEAFQAGRHAKAVELAKPLAEQGNAEALYLLGFAHESGQGAEASKDKALEFVNQYGMTYPSLFDPEGELLGSVPGIPPKAVPSTLILDREGRIAVRIIGPVPIGLDALIASVLDPATAAPAS